MSAADDIRTARTTMRNAIIAAIQAFTASTGVTLQRIDIQFTEPTGTPPTTTIQNVVVRWVV